MELSLWEVMDSFAITTSCKHCGSVSIEADALRLHLEKAPVSHFSTNCPVCGRLLGGMVATLAAVRLAAGGAVIADSAFSPEVLERPEGPKIEPDELIDFHNLLEAERWFQVLQTSGKAGDA